MEQKDKDLLLKDLCARLPYKIRCSYYDICLSAHCNGEIYGIENKEYAIVDGKCIAIGFIKPYLFPLSSMTEEQTEEVHSLIYQGVSGSVDETKEWLKTRKENDLRPITLTYILSYKLVIDWFCKNHFDYRGLIPMGLALNATGKNIY